jgi:hypothetical protein
MPASSITCAETAQLIAEASSTGCRSPWEMDLLELSLLNRIYDALGDVAAIQITADMTTITADSTLITADETQF